jgi:hypothetical protein
MVTINYVTALTFTALFSLLWFSVLQFFNPLLVQLESPNLLLFMEEMITVVIRKVLGLIKLKRNGIMKSELMDYNQINYYVVLFLKHRFYFYIIKFIDCSRCPLSKRPREECSHQHLWILI